MHKNQFVAENEYLPPQNIPAIQYIISQGCFTTEFNADTLCDNRVSTCSSIFYSRHTHKQLQCVVFCEMCDGVNHYHTIHRPRANSTPVPGLLNYAFVDRATLTRYNINSYSYKYSSGSVYEAHSIVNLGSPKPQ